MTEELRMILDAINELGSDGKEALIWYIGLKYGAVTLNGLFVLLGVLIGLGIVRKVATQVISSFSLAPKISEALGMGIYAPKMQQQILQRVRDLLASEKEQQ